MVQKRWVKAFAVVAATLGWTALALQLYLTMSLSLARGKGLLAGAMTYFSFFTILTNILVALALTVPLLRSGSRVAEFFSRPTVNTGIAASIAVVGIAYTLLLRHLWDPKGLQLVADVILHHLMPALFLVYWWVAVPKGDLRGTIISRWVLYPVVYFLFVIVRGELSGVYPYPFIDASQLGSVRAFGNAVGILLGFIAVGLVLVAVGRLRGAARNGTRRTEKAICVVATLFSLFGCSRPAATTERHATAPIEEKATFVNRVWRVAESSGMAPGQLVVFLSDGTLVFASPHEKPALGTWTYDGESLTMVEEGRPYKTEILGLGKTEFRIRSHNPAGVVETWFVPAEGSPPHEPPRHR